MDQKTCNSSIHCTVANCAYHAPQNCCSLKSINVGCCDSAPTSCKGTERLVPAEVTHPEKPGGRSLMAPASRFCSLPRSAAAQLTVTWVECPTRLT